MVPEFELEKALAAAAAAAAAEEGFSPPTEGIISDGVPAPMRPPMTAGDRERVLPPRRLVVVVRGAVAAAVEGTDAVDGGRFGFIAIGMLMESVSFFSSTTSRFGK